MELNFFTIAAAIFAGNVLFATFMHGARGLAKVRDFHEASWGAALCFSIPPLLMAGIIATYG